MGKNIWKNHENLLWEVRNFRYRKSPSKYSPDFTSSKPPGALAKLPAVSWNPRHINSIAHWSSQSFEILRASRWMYLWSTSGTLGSFYWVLKMGICAPPPIAAISLWRQWIHWITMNNRSEWWWTQISGSSVPKTGAKANNPSMKTAYEWGQLHLQFAKRLLWIGNPSHKHPTHQHSSHITGDAQSQTSTGFISTHQTNHIDCQHQKTSMTL